MTGRPFLPLTRSLTGKARNWRTAIAPPAAWWQQTTSACPAARKTQRLLPAIYIVFANIALLVVILPKVQLAKLSRSPTLKDMAR